MGDEVIKPLVDVMALGMTMGITMKVIDWGMGNSKSQSKGYMFSYPKTYKHSRKGFF